MTNDLTAAVEKHTALFNTCVNSGDWAPFVATFTDDARVTLTNVPAGPYDGRAEIARMYAARPPTETMSVLGVKPIDDSAVRVSFAWRSGRRSTMVVRWRGAMVCGVDMTL